MSIWEWLFGRREHPAYSPIPPAPSDALGALTLPPAAAIPVAAVGDAPALPEAAMALVKKWEGFRPKPYLCPAGIPTIGYGTTVYLDGRRVTLKDAAISEGQAAVLMRAKMAEFSTGVAALVKVRLSANERGALTSLAYNIGLGAFRNSTLLRKLNAGDKAGAVEQFGVWVKGGGKTLPGLVSRRAEEAALFVA